VPVDFILNFLSEEFTFESLGDDGSRKASDVPCLVKRINDLLDAVTINNNSVEAKPANRLL
jgi:hypothetical protein